MKTILAALLMLASCAAPPQQVFTPQPVDMPVAAGCKAPTLTPPPDVMAALPDNSTLTDGLKSCLRQTLGDKGFIEQLTAALTACQ